MNKLSPRILSEVFQVKSLAHTLWGIKINYIVEIPKQWRMGLSQSRLWHQKFDQQCLRNWKTINLYILSKKVWGNGNQAVHVGHAKPTCSILVLYNKHVWYWNKNICHFVIYLFYSTCIFFFFYVFHHRKVDADLETKWLADLLN